jgi:hypothetical protein
VDRGFVEEEVMSTRRGTKYVHEGPYVAAIEVDWIDSEAGWSHWPSMDDARKLEGVSKRQPLQSVFPIRYFRRQPDEQEFVDRRPDVETLRNEEYTCAAFSGGSEHSEMGRHGADIVLNKNAILSHGQRKDFRIPHAPQSGT